MAESGSARARAPLALLAAFGALCALVATGCQTPSAAQRDVDLAEFLTLLPGTWDDAEQVEAGGARAQAVRMRIQPIDAPFVGHHVFYAQLEALDDPRRILSQQMLSFEMTDEGTIVQTSYVFTEPRRWREALLNPELFIGLQPPDFHKLAACPLQWKRAADRFAATLDERVCRAAAAHGGGAPTVRAELRREEYAVARQGEGAAPEPLDRFRKRSAP